MADSYKLILDAFDCGRTLDTIEEQANAGEEKKLYVEGIFGQAGQKNKNGRIYDPEEMQKDIERFTEEFIKEGRAFNELNHPNNPDVNLERACDRTVSLTMDSKGTVYGKAIVLDTPMGRIQKALIDEGRVGKSSRAMGQVSEAKAPDGSHCNYVSGLRLVCHDTVNDPSVGSAIVDPLLEQKEWIIGEDGGFLLRPFEDLNKTLMKLPRHDKEQYIVESITKFLQDIKF